MSCACLIITLTITRFSTFLCQIHVYRVFSLEKASEGFSGESSDPFGHHAPELLAHVGGLPDVPASHSVPFSINNSLRND